MQHWGRLSMKKASKAQINWIALHMRSVIKEIMPLHDDWITLPNGNKQREDLRAHDFYTWATESLKSYQASRVITLWRNDKQSAATMLLMKYVADDKIVSGN